VYLQICTYQKRRGQISGARIVEVEILPECTVTCEGGFIVLSEARCRCLARHTTVIAAVAEMQ